MVWNSLVRPGAVAVVTGGASGIGEQLVQRLAARKVSVVVADVNADAAEAVVKLLTDAGSTATAVRVDVTDPDDVDALADTVYDSYGRVDLLFNNAGIEAHGRVWEFSPKLWRTVMGVNVDGVFFGLRSFIPRMLELDQPAHIVNTASVASLGIAPYTAPYRVGKHAALALSEIVELELSEITDRIRVSSILPSMVKTALWTDALTSDDDFGQQSKTRMKDWSDSGGISAEKAAELILDGVDAGRRLIHLDPAYSSTEIERRVSALRGSLQNGDAADDA